MGDASFPYCQPKGETVDVDGKTINIDQLRARWVKDLNESRLAKYDQ